MASMVDLVFDTSAVINGQMIKLAKSGAIKDSQVIIANCCNGRACISMNLVNCDR